MKRWRNKKTNGTKRETEKESKGKYIKKR